MTPSNGARMRRARGLALDHLPACSDGEDSRHSRRPGMAVRARESHPVGGERCAGRAAQGTALEVANGWPETHMKRTVDGDDFLRHGLDATTADGGPRLRMALRRSLRHGLFASTGRRLRSNAAGCWMPALVSTCRRPTTRIRGRSSEPHSLHLAVGTPHANLRHGSDALEGILERDGVAMRDRRPLARKVLPARDCGWKRVPYAASRRLPLLPQTAGRCGAAAAAPSRAPAGSPPPAALCSPPAGR